VCFDLDGVLIDTMPLHAQAWQDALDTLRLSVLRRDIYEWEGEPGVVTARTLLLRRGGRPPSRQTIASLLREKERRFSRLARHIRVNPRLGRLLSTLRARRIRLGLVTGTSSREIRRVVSKRLLSVFTVVISGDQVRHGKPHPEPYRTAIRKLGVPPGKTIVVENAPYGIRSGRAAGAGLVIALASSLPSRFLQEADVIVTSIPKLCRLLEDLTAAY